MSTVLSPPEARVILHNISWSLYEQLLAAHADNSSPRFAYDRGELEITVPSYEHEELNRLLDNCIALIALEWNIEYCNAGSTTFKREDLERGFEPDSCFYVQHAGQVAGKKRLDLTVDPPPDLVLEVDITHPSLDKLSISPPWACQKCGAMTASVSGYWLWQATAMSNASRVLPFRPCGACTWPSYSQPVTRCRALPGSGMCAPGHRRR